MAGLTLAACSAKLSVNSYRSAVSYRWRPISSPALGF